MTEQPISVFLPEPRSIPPTPPRPVPLKPTHWHWSYLLVGVLLGLAVGYFLFESELVLAPVGNPDKNDLASSAYDFVSEKPGATTKIEVIDQIPGDEVIVKSVQMSAPGWIAVHDNLDGQPGRTLGAAYLSAGAYQNQVISLLRGTIDGEPYLVVIHNDDGDKVFNLKTDLPRVDAKGNLNQAVFIVTAPNFRGD